MGLIINRPLSMSVSDAWEQVSAVPYQNNSPLHQGGPCEGMLMVLHRRKKLGQIPVVDGIFLATDADVVKELVEADEQPMKFVVGYAGWSPGQLEEEIREGAWVLAEAGPAEVFNTPEDLWLTLARAATQSQPRPNIDPRRIPPDPSVN
jgi:putative transcriptional regulator